MIVLGVDPGYERLGIAILRKDAGDRRETLLYSTCFRTSPKDAHALRLAQILQHIMHIIEVHKPDVLAIETLFFSKNTTTALKVAEARGTVIAACAGKGLQVLEFSPQDIKIAVTGNGSSDKTQVMKMIPLLIAMPEQKKLDDEYDAIAAGLTCFAMSKNIHTR
ncbi:MAG: crossover junction endodeoxyribonuclease RuvC, crossover junction endodeoxyribonuclease RuvC [Candidatus Parcubacteria bacterium]|jgi:crossover junction endodeoxyribonuclease RuvC